MEENPSRGAAGGDPNERKGQSRWFRLVLLALVGEALGLPCALALVVRRHGLGGRG